MVPKLENQLANIVAKIELMPKKNCMERRMQMIGFKEQKR
jgi:hypothetical protein